MYFYLNPQYEIFNEKSFANVFENIVLYFFLHGKTKLTSF